MYWLVNTDTELALLAVHDRYKISPFENFSMFKRVDLQLWCRNPIIKVYFFVFLLALSSKSIILTPYALVQQF